MGVYGPTRKISSSPITSGGSSRVHSMPASQIRGNGSFPRASSQASGVPSRCDDLLVQIQKGGRIGDVCRARRLGRRARRGGRGRGGAAAATGGEPKAYDSQQCAQRALFTVREAVPKDA